MNFHILLVHFPIALLSVYVAIELVQLVFFRRAVWLVHAKTVILWVGATAVVPTILAGIVIHEPFERAVPELLNAHRTFASLTAGTFLYLALCYAIVAIIRVTPPWATALRHRFPGTYGVLSAIAAGSTIRPVVQGLALMGFCFLLITGALGGALAHGRDIDPIVSFIYSIVVE